ncbi:MAG: M20 family metallopeptidase [Pirellulales bacterium]|nr:M20 family metallopeptidase [Pirellulales bacterium]
MSLDLIATLRDLVATPSVNPMGRALDGPEYCEYRVTDYLERLFARLGIPSQRQTVAPKRDNLFALLEGDPPLEQGGRLVMLEAHQDTVPTDGMTIPPFDSQIRDGRLFGRGACDIKGGMAAMLHAFSRLADTRPKPRPTVVMACTVNEEHGFTGAMKLCRTWFDEPSSMIPRRPDAAIVAEPTNLNVVVAHKGMVRWRCHVLGRSAHSSQPELGENAIFRMAPVLAALERYQRDIVGKLAEHPLCGRPTLSVGIIGGGVSVNTVPGRCTIEIDRRIVPGEQPLAARQHAMDYLEAETQLGDRLQHDPPYMQGRGLPSDNNGELGRRLIGAVRQTTGRESRIIGVPYGTDAAILGPAGVPCVVFGPGSIDQAHTADEWVPLAEVEAASEVLYRAMADWLT